MLVYLVWGVFLSLGLSVPIPINKESAWASMRVTKKGEVAEGSTCWSCGTVHARAYAGYTWVEVVSLCKTSSTFANTFAVAKKVLDGEKRPQWVPEDVTEKAQTAVKIQKALFMVTVQDFEQAFSIKLSQAPEIAELFQEVHDEYGGKTRAIFVKDPQAPYRRVVLEHSVGLEVARELAKASDQLRPDQGSDLALWLGKERRKTQPKSWQEKPIMVEELESLVSKAQERLTQQRAAEAAPAAPLAPPAAEAAEEVSSPEKEMVVSRVDSLVLPKAAPRAEAKAKGRSGKPLKRSGASADLGDSGSPSKRGRGRGAGAAGSKGIGRGAPTASGAGQDSSEASTSLSGLSSAQSSLASTRLRGKQSADPGKTLTSYRKYMKALNAETALNGGKVLSSVYNASPLLQLVARRPRENPDAGCLGLGELMRKVMDQHGQHEQSREGCSHSRCLHKC